MNPQIDQAIDVTHYLRIFWRRKGIVLLCAITVFCSAFLMLQFTPKSYTASAVLRIVDPKPMTRDVESLMGGTRLAAPSYSEAERREAELVNRIRSAPFLRRVVLQVRMHEDPSIRASARERARELNQDVDTTAVALAIQALRPRIGITKEGLGVYRVSVETQSPQLAMQLANWTTSFFQDNSKRLTDDQRTAARELGQNRREYYEERLRRSEEAWEAARRDLLVEKELAGGLVRPENLEFTKELERKIREDATALYTSVGPPSPEVLRLLRDSTIVALQGDLYAALREDATGRLATDTREIGGPQTTSTYNIRRRDILRDVERRVAAIQPTESPSSRERTTRAVFSHMNRAAQLQVGDLLASWTATYEELVRKTPKAETALARLEDEVRKNRALLQSFDAEVLAADVTALAEDKELGYRIEIMEEATLPFTPSHPDKQKVVMMALLLGPLLGIGLAFVSETMDRTLRTIDDFRRIAPEPILGTAPLLSRRAVQKPGRLRRHWVPVGVGAVLLLTGMIYLGGALFLRSEPAPPPAVESTPLESDARGAEATTASSSNEVAP